MANKPNNSGNLIFGTVLGALIAFGAEKIYDYATRYDKEGFDKNGYNKDGFDRDGYSRDGYNSQGYDRNGFNRSGFNRNGFNVDGFNCHGYDKHGFNRDGYDKYGYDRNGRNVNGYDRKGYDTDGFDKYGYAEDGFNREGLDRDGYDRHGYNIVGIDREGKPKEFYEERFGHLRSYLDKAYSQLKCDEIAYALYEARRVLEEVLEQYVKHFCGTSKLGKTPEENINICAKKKLLNEELINNLHSARRQCNKDPHEIDARENLNHKTAWSILMHVEHFLDIAECDLIYG